MPKPTPFDAPGINPGISATTKLEQLFIFTTPKFGLRVVKGYSAIFGFADDILEIKVDLPALGFPRSPTSAKTFNSSLI